MTDTNDLTLFELIECCKNNELKAQSKLYDLYRTKMYYYILKFCNYNNDEDFVDHVLSMSFSRIFKKIHQFRHQGSFDGWIRRIVRGEIYTYFKINKTYKDRYLVMDVFKYIEEENEHKRLQNNVFVDNNPNGSDELILTEYFDYIKKSLSNREYTVFKLSYDGFTHKEIAKQLCITEGTIKWYMSEARAKLRTNFKNHFSFNIKN